MSAKKKRKKKVKKKSLARRSLLFFVKLFLIVTLLIALFIAAVNYGVFGQLYSKNELKNFKNETASLVFTEDGKIIGKFFAENRTNVSIKDIPLHLIDALVATEDARYFEHNGIDSWSLVRVFFKTLILNDHRSGGGSTISQQLAKNMYGRKNFGPITMLVNKCKEAILAYRLEDVYDKKEIIRLYLNTVPFGENVYGIEAASSRYFNKKTKLLKVEEAAVLVGILKANTFYNPRLNPENASRRRNVVLNQMEKYGYLKKTECDSLKNLKLRLDYANYQAKGPANYFVVKVKKQVRRILEDIEKETSEKWDLEKDGLKIKTTLNASLQRFALESYKIYLTKMQKQLRKQYSTSSASKKTLEKLVTQQLKKLDFEDRKDKKSRQELFSWNGFYSDSISVKDSLKHTTTLLHAGLIGMDPNNGAIKCWVGGIDYRTQPNDQILAKRSLASTFKPILYAAALESGIEPCSYLSNEPITLKDFDNWSPANYDKTTGGKYSLSGALTRSLNIPTVNLFFETEFKSVDYLWEKLGFSSDLKNVPSTALGTSSASLYELSIAYSAFANGGFKVEPQMILSITAADGKVIYQNPMKQNSKRVLKAETSELISTILQKAINEGTGRSIRNVYNVKLPLAGKTGTSQNYADAWFAGFNPNLVILSRVGASSPSIHFNTGVYGSGGKLALPLVALTLQQVQNNPSVRKKLISNFPPPSQSIIDQLDCIDYKEETAVEELLKIFNKDETTVEKQREKSKKKKSWLNRIFGKKKE